MNTISRSIRMALYAIAILFISMFILIFESQNVYAAEEIASGSAGSIEWVLDSDGVMTVSGQGGISWDSYTTAPWYSNRTSIKNVVIEKGISYVGQYAFANCNWMTSITIPAGVTSIGPYAFSGCGRLTSITIPEDVTSIGYYAFENCRSLTSITIPEGVTSIESYTFKSCRELTSITIPAGVTSIGSHAFQDCRSLSSIIIPEGVTSIEIGTFAGCPLNRITVPGSVTSMGYYSFVEDTSIMQAPITICTVPNSYASTLKNLIDQIEYLCEPYEPKYLGFNSDVLFIKKGEGLSLSDYLLTGFDISDCTVTVPEEAPFIYDKDEGEIVSLGVGECTITVAYGDYTATATIISQDSAANIEGISFKDTTLNLPKGESYVNTVTLSPQSSDVGNISWKSSDRSVATVTDGKIEAVGFGTATITAYSNADNTIYDECEVIVETCPLYNIIPFETEITMKKGATKKLQYYKYPSDTTEEITFISDNEDVVTIDKNGKATAKGLGKANIKISFGDNTKSIKVTVHNPLTGLSLEQNSITASCGDQIQLIPVLEPADAEETEIIWSSSNEPVATVDKAGLVTVHSKGIATITATAGDYSASCKVVCSTPHTWDEELTVDKKVTCTEDGKESIHCIRCGAVQEGSEITIPATGHKFSAWKIKKKATELAAGQQSRTCSACGKVETKTIAQLKPTLPAVTIVTPVAAKKAATIKWKKVSAKNQKKIAKIQIQYSTDKNFKKGVKTVYAKKSATSKKITKLTSKKTYYVRIRAYKSSGGVVHISKWSTRKSVKVK